MANQFGVGNSLTDDFIPATTATDPSKTGFVFARRTLNEDNQIVLPTNGAAYPSPYIPFNLTAYTDGLSAVVALRNMGFTYTPGSSVSETIVAPDLITTNSTLGLVYLIWSSTTTGLENIAGSNPTGSVTQVSSSAAANIRNITIDQTTTTLTVSMVNGSADFDTSGNIVVNATLSTSAPNPLLSDEIVVFVYWYFQKYPVSPQFTTSPNLWVSILIDGRDTDISPSASAIALIAPTAAAVQTDGSVNLTYAVTADNLGLLPTAYFGSSTVTQATSTATGTYNGFKFSTGNVVINVTNITGVFDTTHTISILLDVSRNGGTLTGKTEIGGYGMCFPVPNAETLSTDYPAFVSLIAAKRAPTEVSNNQFNVQGYYGFVPSYIGQYQISEYTAPDTTAYVWTVKLDIPTVYQYPCNTAMIVAQSLYTDMNNEPPYNADVGENALLNVTVSSNQASYPTDDVLDQLVSQGATPIGITDGGLPYWYQRVCTLQTISDNQDTEYRYESLQEKVRWLDRNIEITNRQATISPQTGQRLNNTPLLIKNVTNRGKNVLQEGVDAGMLGTTNNTVAVIINPANVTRLKETVTTTIVSQNNGIDTVVYISTYEG